MYQATGTNRWVRPPVPKSTMDKNKPRRNSAGFARYKLIIESALSMLVAESQ